MNGITILIWLTIAIIGIIAIILVKLHFRGDELEKEEGFILNDNATLNKALSTGQDFISNNLNRNNSPQRSQKNYSRLEKENSPKPGKFDAYIVPEVAQNNYQNIEYENSNQVLVNYGNTVQKFQEPIKQSQMDIMNSNNNEKTELKDLFTIDELIKESKRKDSEREKEAQKISSEEDEELNEIKESIKRRKENAKLEDVLIEKIEDDTPEIKEETINDLINESSTDEKETKIESAVSQKDIEEAINTAAKESEESAVESLSESQNITDVLLDNKDEESVQETLDVKEESAEDIDETDLKEPKKIDEERKEEKFGIEIEENNALDEYNDLDYRKDLAKVTNTIKQSKIFQDVKEKLIPEEEEPEPVDESFIRNVNEYDDEFAPIINERHLDYDATYEEYHLADNNQKLRQENTRKVFNMAKNSQEPEISKPKIENIKEKPERDNIKLQLGNNDVVLKKGDEIIFNHQGETYSSQVYAINGDDISVKYRRKNIKIKPSDVKKVY